MVLVYRVPIAALLRPDAVEKFVMHDRTYYKYKNDIYNFPADDVCSSRLTTYRTN